MDQPAVGAETFILKIYIYSRAGEIKMVKLLEDIQGVHRISVDPTEIGKITILGTIDPKKLMKILRNNGIKSEQVFEPMINRRDLPNVPRPKSPGETYHVTIDKEAVEGLETLSKLKGFQTVDLTKDGMKLKYKKDENVRNLDGKTGSCSRNMDENVTHKKGEHVMNNYCDFHGNYESSCSRNQGMYVQYCHGCGTNCRYMAPHEGISMGIPSPVPEYNPSAPPMPAEYDPDPRSRKPYSDHGSTNNCSDDNPAGFVVFFFLFFFISLIQAALS